MTAFLNSLLGLIDSFGYGGIIALMAIESSFIPFPSEIVIPPAAFLASQGEMNIYLVVLSGVFGSLIGASINYFLAMLLGRPIVYALTEKKYAKFFLISSKKVEKAEHYFLNYGEVSTFVGRLIPAVRQLISLPAGFTRMHFGKFLLWTALGSTFWVTILAILGFYFGENEALIKQYSLEFSLGFAAIVLLIGLLYFWRRKR